MLHTDADKTSSAGRFALLFILFGAPAAWVAQMSLSEIITSYACYPHTMPVTVPLLINLHIWLIVTNIGCLVMGIPVAISAFGLWRKTASLKASQSRVRFLALLGILSATLFLIAILFTASAFLMVSPCGT